MLLNARDLILSVAARRTALGCDWHGRGGGPEHRHDIVNGSDFQAGVPITSSLAETCSGCCTACITLALPGSTSAAKSFTKSSSGQPSEALLVDVEVRQRLTI
jgi:hypothetical protein